MEFSNVLYYMIYHYLRRITLTQLLCCLICVTVIVLIGTIVTNEKFLKIYNLLWIVYLSAIISVTFLGRNFHMISSSWSTLFITYEVILSGKMSWGIYEVIFNIILFIPFGALIHYKAIRIKRNIILILFFFIIYRNDAISNRNGCF